MNELTRPHRPRHRCEECGVTTQSALAVCAPCLERGIAPLVNGAWVRDGLILRWVAA